MHANEPESRFAPNGRSAARSANLDQVRAEVEEAYAEVLAKAGLWESIRLRLLMRREIRRRIKKLAPDDALYLSRR
jgi:hypothetical protein